MHAGIWLIQNQDPYTQKCIAFMLPGPTLMQMSTGLAFDQAVHGHCHFFVCRHDVCLVTHSLHILSFQLRETYFSAGEGLAKDSHYLEPTSCTFGQLKHS